MAATNDIEFANQLTIEQLAAQAGMSVRNIRAHQARGLLPPPEVRMRVGYYGSEHLAQLRLIRELQEQGFNLNGIKQLLEDREGTAERLLQFRVAASADPAGEHPELLSAAELGRRFHVSAREAPDVLAKAERLGLLVPVGEDSFKAPSPSLLTLAEEVVARGISLSSALAMLEEIQRHCDSVSKAFVKLFLEEVWKPFAAADMPSERWPEIEAAVQRLRPVASQALLAIFQGRLGVEIEQALAEIARRLGEQAS